ncbi:hypothetical protein [Aurantiacibacter luteus]|nr:hypothetical protein [Aurantiacibacter luteus]
MTIDIPSLVLAGAILAVSALASLGGISEEVAQNAFILLPLGAFVWSRRQVCRGECRA